MTPEQETALIDAVNSANTAIAAVKRSSSRHK